MITPAFNLTATERVLPKLALDFTTASLDSRVTFTRTTSASNPATYVNSSGNITAATNNQPRFDYDPVTLVCKGLLIEESRTNICLNSQTLNTSWLTTNMSVGADVVVSPDGTQNADSLTDDATSGSHAIRRVFAISPSTTYTYSLYVKPSTQNYVQLLAVDGNTADRYATAVFDVTSGSTQIAATQTAVSTGTTLIGTTQQAVGNGWFRVTLSFTSGSNWAIATTSARIGFAPAASGNTIATTGGISYSGTGTVLYAWGAQVEAGAFATSYIPTTTTALTRNADVATMTGTNFSDWYNQSEGALSCEFAFIGYDLANRDRIASITDATGNEEIGIIQNSTNGYGRFEVVDGGANQALLNCINTTMVAGTTYQICGTYKVNSFCGSGSLGSQATDASGTIPTPDRMCIGGNGPGTTTAIFNGHMKSINYWPQRITNNETLAFAKI